MDDRLPPNRSERTAGPSSWKNHPLPERRVTIGFDRPYSEQEMAAIRLGSVPKQMEDKWFVYYAQDQLFFVRSWTGYCVYLARFRPTDEGALLVSADINRDPGQYTETDDAFDAQMVLYLIDALLLDRHSQYPGGEENPLKLWSILGRLMLGERPGDDSPPVSDGVIDE